MTNQHTGTKNTKRPQNQTEEQPTRTTRSRLPRRNCKLKTQFEGANGNSHTSPCVLLDYSSAAANCTDNVMERRVCRPKPDLRESRTYQGWSGVDFANWSSNLEHRDREKKSEVLWIDNLMSCKPHGNPSVIVPLLSLYHRADLG